MLGGRKALFVLTRCVTVDEFVASFHVFCDGTSLFVPTQVQRPVGLEAPFSFQLADGKPVLSGVGIVLEVFPTKQNVFNRPGLRLGLSQLTPESVIVHARLKPGAKSGRLPTNPIASPKLSRAPSSPGATTAAPPKATPADGTPLRIEDLDLFDRTAPISIIGPDGSAPLVEVSFVKPPTVRFSSPAPEALDVPEEVIEPEAPAPRGEESATRTTHRRQLIAVGAVCSLGGAAIALAVATIAWRSAPDATVAKSAPPKAASKPAPKPVAALPAAPVVQAAIQAAPVIAAAPPPAPARCTLSIAATPPDAEIVVAGQALGTSPAFFVGDCGAAVVEVKRKRYETATQTVTFEDGSPQTLTVRLKRPKKRVSAESVPRS